MEKHHRKSVLSGALLLGLPLFWSPIYAAKPIDLYHQKTTLLQHFITGLNNNGVNIQELSREFDFKKTLHIRIRETYNGYPVWGGDAIIHVPNGQVSADLNSQAAYKDATMNGIFYDGLSADLANAPAIIFTEANAQKALQHAILAYEQKVGGKPYINKQKSSLMVYVDKDNKAHWAYKVSFEAASLQAGEIPAQPTYILDAVTLNTYEEWNDMKSNNAVFGGGYGGNKKMGKLVYDGLQGDLGKLNLVRNGNNICYFQNQDVTVKKCTSFIWNYCFEVADSTTQCTATDPDHNNVYWNGDEDAVNGGYSPTNDALFNGAIIKDMYKTWYDLPVLKDPSDPTGQTPMMLTMIVHLEKFDNAYWDGEKMNFGDGDKMFYPLTSLGVAAHEISHGFTSQHSDLNYNNGQSGGMNEAFSDMAAQAAESFAYDKNSWQIGPEIFKKDGEALRYMDQPSKDCHGAKPAPGVRCSLDDASQYKDGIDVHFTSGVYNHFFYKLATTDGWNVRKAFDVMVYANAFCWTPNTVFSEDPKNAKNSGSCCVINAAKTKGYDVNAVKAAFDAVKITYSTC